MPPPAVAPVPARKPPKPTPPAPPPVPPDLEVYAEPGDVVEWFPGADLGEAAQPAMVTGLGNDSKVAVNVFNPYMGYSVPQDGCYHMDHPKARVDNGAGGWRHKPITIAARKMFLRLGLMAWNAACTRLVLTDLAVEPLAAEITTPPK